MPVHDPTHACERLLVDDRGDRLVVQLHRPHARNAIDLHMNHELHDICRRLEQDPKPLLLLGGPGYFAAGADIGQLLRRGRDDALAGLNSSLFERVLRLPMPTVAVIDGYAFGGGAELAYACDIRVASTRARFANPEPRLGIIAGAGACWRLRDLVGEAVAKQVLLAGRELDADFALRCGLVAEVVDPSEVVATAHRFVDEMLKSSTTALRLTKLVLDGRGGHPTTSLLANAILFEDSEKQDRMQAFLEASSRRGPDAAPS